MRRGRAVGRDVMSVKVLFYTPLARCDGGGDTDGEHGKRSTVGCWWLAALAIIRAQNLTVSVRYEPT